MRLHITIMSVHAAIKEQSLLPKETDMGLTHLCLMEFPTLISWTNAFRILVFEVSFNIIRILQNYVLLANSEESDQTPHTAASDLVLLCLSYIKNDRLIWVTFLHIHHT